MLNRRRKRIEANTVPLFEINLENGRITFCCYVCSTIIVYTGTDWSVDMMMRRHREGNRCYPATWEIIPT